MRPWVLELQIGFQDVAFLPSHGSFGEGLRMATCLKTVFRVSKDMLPVKYLLSNKSSFMSVEFHCGHKAVT